MTDITDRTPWPLMDRALAARLELVEAASAAAYAGSQALTDPGFGPASLELGGGAIAVYCGPDSPISRAIGLGMGNEPFDIASLDRAEAFYRQREHPVPVEVCPLADDGLLSALEARGYVVGAGFRHILIRPLECRLGRRQAPVPTCVSVSQVDKADAEAVALWVEMISLGFAGLNLGGEGLPTAGRGSAVDTSIARPTPGQPAVRLLQARADGELAGGGVLELRDDLALLRSQSTMPRFRGRGVQTEIVRQSLALAAAAGCRLAVVQTSPGTGSQRNMERAGFRIAYTKLTVTLGKPAP